MPSGHCRSQAASDPQWEVLRVQGTAVLCATIKPNPGVTLSGSDADEWKKIRSETKDNLGKVLERIDKSTTGFPLTRFLILPQGIPIRSTGTTGKTFWGKVR